MSRNRVTIFGGSGFIGSAVSKRLIEEGFHVRVADLSYPKPGHFSEFISCDIRDHRAVQRAAEDSDVVINTAIIQIPRISQDPKLGYEVNVIGTQNVCEAVVRNSNCKGLIHAGTWHTVGEIGLEGIIDEDFGYRPDKVEERARIYVLTKVCQEVTVRLFNYIRREKRFIVLRTGTVMGRDMPEQTAARIFIKNALQGRPITPYRHSMHRPMLYVDVNDVSNAYLAAAKLILDSGETDSPQVFNVFHPEPITIIELAEEVKRSVEELTKGRIAPTIEVLDQGVEPLYTPQDKFKFTFRLDRLQRLLGQYNLRNPRESVRDIIRSELENSGQKLSAKRELS
ncbi:MAG: NAD(P)-dependent oxidoreductase [Aigarchaeota archaeon]|nr:NAD(P)-dependent oxidoreductase [Aigarchaeota archaeon]MDW8092461.1 NAD(P)-dependent oxidoreductase [Nitrososphaerota archaeon]